MEPPQFYIDDQLKKAKELKLYETSHWKRLLHMYSSGGECSDYDGGYFFLAKDGVCNPESELYATIKALATKENTALAMYPEAIDLHPLVKYRARLHFLQKHGLLADSLLPDVDQTRWSIWKNSLNPSGIKIVFATGFFGNPASIMGHTFLRLESQGNTGNRAPLNYAITFSANRGDDNGIEYAWKGIFGGYPGTYGIVQYHIHMQSYLNEEGRDLWEYSLPMNKEELNFLIEHIWETGLSWQNYWFFTENCSYGLLTLLEATGTRFDFSSIRKGSVLPIESLREILSYADKPHLIELRTSLKKKFYTRASNLTPSEKEMLKPLLKPRASYTKLFDTSKLNLESQAEVADAALDFIQWQKRSSRADSVKNNLWTNAQKGLIKERINLPRGDFGVSFDGIPQESPDLVHLPKKLTLSTAYENKGLRHGLAFRYSYHDFLQNASGMDRGTELEILHLKSTWAPDYPFENNNKKTNMPELAEFIIAKSGALVPINPWINPWSWHGELSFKRRSPMDRWLSGYFDAAVGWSYGSNLPSNSIIYSLPGIRVWYPIDINFGNVAMGPGIKTGYLKEFNPHWAYGLQGSIWKTFFDNPTIEKELSSKLRWNPSINTEFSFIAALNQFSNNFEIQYAITW